MASTPRRRQSMEEPPDLSELMYKPNKRVTMATNTNTSSRYDNITCKVLIQSGSPAVYQLIPKKEKIGSLTRMTLGEKDPNKKNKTILLVGEPGTGKSTLINALVNYAMGVEWEDDVWFQIVEEEKRSQSESQTSDVIVYQIFGFEDKTLPYSLTIIDTPGYGDTRGIEHDASVSQRLLDLFQSEDGVHEINAVGLVMKASENRLSDRLRYIFHSVISLFGKDIEKNIVALITHSDGVTSENVLKALEDANIKCAKDEDDETVHFLFNNHQSRQKTKKNKVALKSLWELTKDQIGQFADFLTENSPKKLETTVEVFLRSQPEAPLSLQTPTPPQTTSPSSTTLPAPSKPTALLQSPPVDKAQ
uniref:Septin-type G domain-containing protein n=2 Tax=Sander lucioperca TaxID=283035 RepID=A0A8C9XHL8_SANLU